MLRYYRDFLDITVVGKRCPRDIKMLRLFLIASFFTYTIKLVWTGIVIFSMLIRLKSVKLVTPFQVRVLVGVHLTEGGLG